MEDLDIMGTRVTESSSVHDAYRVSLNIIQEKLLGHHNQEFYALIGRITCVSALVEQQIRTLHAALTHANPRDLTVRPRELGPGISQIIAKSQRRLEVIAEQQKGDFETYPGMKISFEKARHYLQGAYRLNQARNGYVHNTWSATRDGRILGYRDKPGKSPADNRVVIEPTIREIREHLIELVALCQEGPEILARIITWRTLEVSST